jgi:hypothetical protein
LGFQKKVGAGGEKGLVPGWLTPRALFLALFLAYDVCYEKDFGKHHGIPILRRIGLKLNINYHVNEH